MSSDYNRVATLVLASRTACLKRARAVEHENIVGAAKTKLDFDDMFKGEEPHSTDAEARELVDTKCKELK